jgi:hypothetical protein
MSPNNYAPKYAELEKVRVFFNESTNTIQITAKTTNGTGLKLMVPTGTGLEEDLKAVLIGHNVIPDPKLRQAESEELPPIALLNFSNQKITTENARSAHQLADLSGTQDTIQEKIEAERLFAIDASSLMRTTTVPLGLTHRGALSWYTPFMPVQSGPKLKTNLFIAGRPGTGKDVMIQTIREFIKAKDLDIETVTFDPKRPKSSYDASYKNHHFGDSLEFLIRLRKLKERLGRVSETQRKSLVVIHELDALIDPPQAGAQESVSRTERAVRAEILDTIIYLSSYDNENATTSFIFASQGPDARHNGLLDTAQAKVAFAPHSRNDRLKGIFGTSLPDILTGTSGRCFVGSAGKIKLTQAFLPVNVTTEN